MDCRHRCGWPRPRSASAASLFATDFQNGKAEPWAARGQGDVRLTTYARNVSLRLTGHAEAIATVSVARPREDGRDRALKLAAFHLDAPADGCFAEYSADGGASLDNGSDDRRRQNPMASTSYSGRVDARSTLSRKSPTLLLRLRASLSKTDGACWGDAISVTAEDTAAPVETQRSQLSAADLTSGKIAGPSALMTAFAKPDLERWHRGAAFEGRLTLDSPRCSLRRLPRWCATSRITSPSTPRRSRCRRSTSALCRTARRSSPSSAARSRERIAIGSGSSSPEKSGRNRATAD